MVDFYIERIFGDSGPFAKTFSGYERRPGQVKLSKAIHKAFEEKYHLIAEGPCGTGKSMAYLVPALKKADGKPVVIVTANIALQEQLVYKDLPLLEKVMGQKIEYALLKGKSNYLCEERLGDFRDEGLFAKNDDENALIQWAKQTETGDVTEFGEFIDAEPDRRMWSTVCGSREDCSSCKEANCFSYKARQRAKHCQIIVTNYHVLFAHFELLRHSGGKARILPKMSLVICDEAHEMAEIAREFARISVSEQNIRQLATTALQKVDEDLYYDLMAATDSFFDDVREHVSSDFYEHIITDPGYANGEGLKRALEAHNKLWSGELGRTGLDPTMQKTLQRRIRRGELALDRLKVICDLSDPNYVYWVEGHGPRDPRHSLKIFGKPKTVNDYLRTQFFDHCDSVIVTSATLTTHGNFSFIKRELGVKAKTLIVDSPFDFDQQVLLVVPRFDTRPGDDDFLHEMVEELECILEETEGRALGLFTSYYNMEHVRDVIDCDYPVLVQGQKPKMKLLEQFLQEKNSVLLGTKSFWQGVDIPGESLTCLFIDKMPFPPPSDPVIAAMEYDGEDAFLEHSLPRAIMALRQGFGRLIRSKTDVGVVVIFDQRVIEKGYNEAVFSSLPPCRVERRPERIQRFLRRKGALSK